MNIYAAHVGDGYLAAASENQAQLEHYMGSIADGDAWGVVELRSVPNALARKLLDQGTSDQFYGDGYAAAFEAAPYVPEGVSTEFYEDEPEVDVDDGVRPADELPDDDFYGYGSGDY